MDIDERDETVRVSALDEQDLSTSDPRLELALRRRVAAKLLKDGSPHRAFGELAQGALSLPLDAAYACDVVRMAREAGMELSAASALETALPKVPPEQRPAVRYRLARVYRRLGRLALAREQLVLGLKESPSDWRLRRQLVVTALEEGTFSLAVEQLLRETEDLVARGRPARAARRAAIAAEVCEERVGDAEGASRQWSRAADQAAAAGHAFMAFAFRALAARALSCAKAPSEVVEESLGKLASAGRAALRAREAEAIAAAVRKGDPQVLARTLSQAAELAASRVDHTSALALLRAACISDPAQPAYAEALEKALIQSRSGRELAALYRERVRKLPAQRTELLQKLALTLEGELKDPLLAAAARAEACGAPAPGQRRPDPEAALNALDVVVGAALDPESMAESLVMRGEAYLADKHPEQAASDFEAALAFAPTHLRAITGIAEAKPERSNVDRLARAFAGLPRGFSGRAAVARRLARLLEWPLGELPRARGIWFEVLADSPGDPEAEKRLVELARSAGDRDELISLLRRRLSRQPRGPSARAARHEIAVCLDELGRPDDALDEFRAAAQADPADAKAFLALAERCEARRQWDEAANALEGAALATELVPERAMMLQRLARLCRDRLSDPTRAALAEARARELLGTREPEPKALRRRNSKETRAVKAPEAKEAATVRPAKADAEPAAQAPAPIALPSVVPAVEEPAPLKKKRKARSAFAAENAHLLEAIAQRPLDPAGYHALAEAYDRAQDPARTALMEEIANALEGDPLAEPLEPRFTLSTGDWMVYKHPDLRASATEFFSLAGPAMCALESAESQQAPAARRPFSMKEGKGAQAVGEALLCAVRVLGIRAPEIAVAAADVPPLRPVNGEPPVILVGRHAIKHQGSRAQLRFFAGRALVTFRPDMMALRLLSPGRLEAYFSAVKEFTDPDSPLPPEARVLGRKIPGKAHARLAYLVSVLEKRGTSMVQLADAARHTANRAGLLVAGGVAPAIAALRAKRGIAEDELGELVRFAASDRYFALRSRSR